MKRKGKAGRPPFKPADRLAERCVIRFRKDELRRLEAEAAAAGLSLATYLRGIILKEGD